MKIFHFLLCCCLLSLTSTLWAEPVAVGAAKVAVTPTHPVALAGYGGRTQEHEGLDTKTWARPLAIGAKDPAVIIAVDNCGIPASVTRAVAAKLQKGHGVKPATLVLAVPHPHTAPSLRDYAVVVWGGRATRAPKRRYPHPVGPSSRALAVSVPSPHPTHLPRAPPRPT